MPFSLGDKEKCILTILHDPETCKWSGSKIAETVGAAQGYVSQVITAFKEAGGYRPERTVSADGIYRRSYLNRSPEAVQKRKDRVIELFQEGEPKIAIARDMNMTRWSVQRYLRNMAEHKELIPCPHCNGTGMIPNPPKLG